MTTLINLLIASFLAMNPAPAQAATASLAAPPAAKSADSQQKAAFKEMLLGAGVTLQAKQVR